MPKAYVREEGSRDRLSGKNIKTLPEHARGTKSMVETGVKGKKEKNSLDSHNSLNFHILERLTPHRVIISKFIMLVLHQ